MPTEPALRESVGVPAAVASLVLDYAERRGHPRDTIVRGLEINAAALDDAEARVANATMRRLWERAAIVLREPAIALEVASEMPLGALGVLGHLLTACASIEEAVHQWERYQRFVGDDVLVAPRRGERHFEVFLTSQIPRSDPAWVYGVEFTLAAIVRGLGELAGRTVVPVAAEFPFPRPAHHARYRAVFGANLSFSSPTVRLLFPSGLLRAKPRTAHPAVYRTLLDKMETRVGNASTDTLAGVERALAELLPTTRVDLRTVSRRVGMSARTLQRRLDEAGGLTFSQVVQTFRMNRAEEMLRRSRTSVEEIGFRLGYSDMAAFHRAFKRLHRMTPGAFRRKSCAE